MKDHVKHFRKTIASLTDTFTVVELANSEEEINATITLCVNRMINEKPYGAVPSNISVKWNPMYNAHVVELTALVWSKHPSIMR